jgi:hypothetical protein
MTTDSTSSPKDVEQMPKKGEIGLDNKKLHHAAEQTSIIEELESILFQQDLHMTNVRYDIIVGDQTRKGYPLSFYGMNNYHNILISIFFLSA